ncbi:hypothetical protein ACTXT7_011153 [Hymenolepis weldensis]
MNYRAFEMFALRSLRGDQFIFSTRKEGAMSPQCRAVGFGIVITRKTGWSIEDTTSGPHRSNRWNKSSHSYRQISSEVAGKPPQFINK